MINIAICEDNKIDRQLLNGIVNSLVSERGMEYEIHLFGNGEALLEQMKDRKYQLIFLDILMEEMDGIEIGKKIRESDLDTEIIYCTSSREFLLASYEVFALGYVLKPYDIMQIGRLLDYFCYKHKIVPTKCLSVISHFVNRKIYFNEIVYVESMNKVVIFHTTTSGEIKVYDKLGNIEKQLLDDKFLRCHQSYIINIDFVARMDENEFITITNNIIPIRRRDRKNIRDRYHQYKKKIF